MKTKTLLLILPFLITSCKQTEEKSYVKEDNGVFKIIDIKESYFEFVGNNLQYHFKGNIQNTSENIYDEVYTKVEIKLELENGNIITKLDYNSHIMFSDIGDTQKSWKPNEERYVNGLTTKGITSDYVPNHYSDYPVKKVYAVLNLDAEDLINRTQNDYELVIDVTDKWNSKLGKTTNQSSTQNKGNFQPQNFDLSKDKYENEPTIIKEIKIVENEVFVVVDIVQLDYSDENKINVINQNQKLRTYKVIPNTLVLNGGCKKFKGSDYIIKNSEELKSFDFILINTNNNGEITQLNLGCF